MRKLIALAASVVLLLTVAPVGPVSAGGALAPRGALDRLDDGPLQVLAHGWAIDEDGSAPVTVHAYVDGAFAAGVVADQRRTDVGQVHGYGNYHGFALAVPLTPGRHRVCVVAINNGAGADTSLGCRTVEATDPASEVAPIGAIDRAEVRDGRVHVDGWALDPDTRRPIGVHLLVDGRFVAAKKATGIRTDLVNQYRRGPWHGFGFSAAIGDGEHNVCVVARDHPGRPGRNTTIGCRTVGAVATPAGGGNGGGNGVVVSPSGIVLPVLEPLADGSFRVMTPCAGETVIADGRFVAGVDVVLDPGHGGVETGSVGANGLVEKSLNLDVARRLQSMLEARGYSVLLTRTTDVRLPLYVRGEIANNLDPAVFVSVHHNGGAVSTRSTPGTETYYQHDSEASKRLAGILYEDLHRALAPFGSSWAYSIRAGVNTRVTGEGTDYYGIHRYTPTIPSVITEPGYLSHSAEAALFAREDVQDAEAAAIADGIERFLTTSDAGSGYNPAFTDPASTGTGGTAHCAEPALR